jgi:hypothetical protein
VDFVADNVSRSLNQKFGPKLWMDESCVRPFGKPVPFGFVGGRGKCRGQANRSQIKRRMTESWGDRSTLERTIQHVLKSMAQWGVLKPGSEKGSLIVARKPIRVSEEIAELLVHGVMLSQGRGMSLSQLVSHPAIFPYKLQLNAATLRKHPCLRVQRQGDQSDFVELA